MASPQLEKTLTALAGEFLVAGQLCLKGYVASLTLKNYPEVDIFCLDPATKEQVAIQVKTKRRGREYYIPEKEQQVPFVFVYIRGEDVEYYVVPGRDVSRLANEERDRYLARHPHVNPKQPLMLSVTNLGDYLNRWELLWRQSS